MDDYVDDREREKHSKEEVEDEVEEVHENGGIINKIISHFTQEEKVEESTGATNLSPLSIIPENKGKESHYCEEKIEEQFKEGNGEVGGGGLINKIMSHLPTFGDTQEEEKEEAQVEQTQEEENHKQDNGADGGGLVNRLITNLPHISLPDDPSPKAEEASFLIHIIQD